jgi:hypothetical protein
VHTNCTRSKSAVKVSCRPHHCTLVKDEAGAALLSEVRLQLGTEAAVPHAAGLQRVLPQPRPPLFNWHLNPDHIRPVVTACSCCTPTALSLARCRSCSLQKQYCCSGWIWSASARSIPAFCRFRQQEMHPMCGP